MPEARTRTRPAPPALRGVEGSIEVSRIDYSEGDIIDQSEYSEKVTVPVLAGVEPAKVRVEGSVTRNMSDFNSVRVSVAVEMPCLPELSEVNRVYQIISQLVENRTQEELADAVENRGPSRAIITGPIQPTVGH